MKTKDLILSDEIRSIFPRPENEELEIATLEKSLLKEGCRDKLTVWKEKNILVDGYRRYALCVKNAIPFEINSMSFSSLESAIGWAVTNQISRRNLEKWQSSKLVITNRQDYYSKLADNNKKLSQGRGKKGKKDASSSFKVINVNDELAREAGVSRDTIVKVKYIMKNSSRELISELDFGKTNINKAYDNVHRKIKATNKAKKNQINLGYINDLSKGVVNQVLCMDVFKGIDLVDDESVGVAFSSPPFNVGMPYKGISDSRPHNEFIGFIKDVLSAIKPKLRSGGRVVFEIENTRVKDTKGNNLAIKYPIEFEVIRIATELGYIYRDTIEWNKGSVGKQCMPLGSYNPSNPCIRSAHSNIIIFSKDQSDLPCVTGDPSFLENKYYDELTKSIWNIQPERHSYGTHCCPMPVQLAQQVIELFSYKGDLVLDPFGGSGTTAIACLRTSRRFIHIDISKTYCAEAKQRIDKELATLEQTKRAA